MTLATDDGRYLLDESLVFEENAWDHVPPPDDQEERIQTAILRQKKSPVPPDKKAKYNSKPSLYWDIFYRHNQNNFFKDRKWLQREFPPLEEVTLAEAGPKTVFEVGCGAGNVVFPLLSSNQNPHLHIHACDFSKNAIRVVKSNPLYNDPPLGTVHASVWDLSSQTLPEGLEPGSVDIVVMVFVLSALHPSEWSQAIANIFTLLKPGGLIVFRDYGRHDLTQLRFREGRLLDDNFYIRGDGTRVYFFEPCEIGKLLTGSMIEFEEDGPQLRMLKIIRQEEDSPTPNHTPAIPDAHKLIEQLNLDGEKPEGQQLVSTLTPTHPAPNSTETPASDSTILLSPTPAADESSSSNLGIPPTPAEDVITPRPSPLPSDLPPHPLFTISQLGIDRRLLVNRKKQLKMYRVWLQGEFRKNHLNTTQ